jgi:hypothetical protein
MNFNYNQMRNQLLRDKVFLRMLYNTDSPIAAKRVLNSAFDYQLNTLLKYLHFLANGKIKIKNSNFQAISANKLTLIKKHVESNRSLKEIMSKTRPEKLQFLNKLIDLYSPLLYALFNEM